MYHDQLTASRMAGHGALIESLRNHTRQQLTRERDIIGFNLAGLRHLQREMEESDDVRFFDFDKEIAGARERGAGAVQKRRRLL